MFLTTFPLQFKTNPTFQLKSFRFDSVKHMRETTTKNHARFGFLSSPPVRAAIKIWGKTNKTKHSKRIEGVSRGGVIVAVFLVVVDSRFLFFSGGGEPIGFWMGPPTPQ